ncbi:DUF1127 domain-containing protein [Celeribacter indicus]|uniref:YjiS-like domain-containing protein n=1 Tax=Celeribacter indicus TaxID=1208324 RepID=A0A0B5E4R9_9RHOB|nr:DUF1127 domain-containing protein [Celeribacter indicus]AJE47362.1 hypothetical protein P73_2647 [Celeribacter indicus]SDW04560.1 protein of unknown function [Celeribacter indicus]
MATLTRTFPITAAIQSRFAALRADVSLRRARRAEMARICRELSALSDRDLTDIGISRDAIRDIAAEAARRV